MNDILAGLKQIFVYLLKIAAMSGFITVFIYTATQSPLVTFISFVLLFLAFIGCDDWNFWV